VTKGDGKERRKEGEENNESKKMIQIVISNIARLKEKTEIFWDYLERFDIIGMCEKLMEERNWVSLKMSLPKNFT